MGNGFRAVSNPPRGLHLGVDAGAKGRRRELQAGLNERRVVFNGEAGVGIEIAEDPAFALGDGLRAEFFRCYRPISSACLMA